MAQPVQPSFVENGPKLRVLILVNWHKPKRAKNRGEPRKMTHCSETEFFLGWSRAYLWYALLTKIAITIQNIEFSTQKIQIFGSKKHIFAPSGLLEPHQPMCSTQKRCVIGVLIWGYQKFYSLPQKNGFLAQKRPKLAQNWHFWPNISIFGPFDLMPDQKTMRTSYLGG